MTMTICRDLPMDLVEEEILCYVPATYLKRLGSTCKRWKDLFNGDSRFARKHFDKAAKQFLVLMLKGYRICPTIFNLHGSVEVKRELRLFDSNSKCSAQFDISRVFHCDGLLLCTTEDEDRFVVWNPFTSETKWFQPRNKLGCNFVLGYYQEDNNKNYKILSFYRGRRYKNEIYEFNSDSWRTIDDIIAPGWRVETYPLVSVSLKGNTYWFVTDETIGQHNISLHKFDFSTEKSEPVPLPYQGQYFVTQALSVVREEKLSLLLQRDPISKTEIWVTNKIDETNQMVSWSKVLALDLTYRRFVEDVSFLFDEEKKVVMICYKSYEVEDETDAKSKDMIYIVREDNEVTQVEVGVYVDNLCSTAILNYVPSLVQIEQAGGKRKIVNLHREAPKQFLLLTLKACRICPTILTPYGSVEVKRELSLVDPHSKCSAQFDIYRVFHCDGLLLCYIEDEARLVVWNPFTGETRWFQTSISNVEDRHFVLGYYQENNNKSYKIFSFYSGRKDYEIYEFSSDSWRTLDDIVAPGRIIGYSGVSLNGNTYWFIIDETNEQRNISLLKFDFSTEKYEPIDLPFPYQRHCFQIKGLSVVGEEKLSVLLQPDSTSKTEIWVSNRIDETNELFSWSKVLALDLSPDLKLWGDVTFLLDEEKQVVMICHRWSDLEDKTMTMIKDKIYIVGEHDEVTQMDFGVDMNNICEPAILNYVPSLVQIERARGKRKRYAL